MGKFDQLPCRISICAGHRSLTSIAASSWLSEKTSNLFALLALLLPFQLALSPQLKDRTVILLALLVALFPQPRPNLSVSVYPPEPRQSGRRKSAWTSCVRRQSHNTRLAYYTNLYLNSSDMSKPEAVLPWRQGELRRGESGLVTITMAEYESLVSFNP